MLPSNGIVPLVYITAQRCILLLRKYRSMSIVQSLARFSIDILYVNPICHLYRHVIISDFSWVQLHKALQMSDFNGLPMFCFPDISVNVRHGSNTLHGKVERDMSSAECVLFSNQPSLTGGIHMFVCTFHAVIFRCIYFDLFWFHIQQCSGEKALSVGSTIDICPSEMAMRVGSTIDNCLSEKTMKVGSTVENCSGEKAMRVGSRIDNCSSKWLWGLIKIPLDVREKVLVLMGQHSINPRQWKWQGCWINIRQLFQWKKNVRFVR